MPKHKNVHFCQGIIPKYIYTSQLPIQVPSICMTLLWKVDLYRLQLIQPSYVLKVRTTSHVSVFSWAKKTMWRKSQIDETSLIYSTYTVLFVYQKQLLTDTTTYLNYQSFNSSLTTFVHAVVSPVKNKSHACKSILTILNCL